MCKECGAIHGHAGQCPMNPDDPEEIMATCPICGREYPEGEMLWSVCDVCIDSAMTLQKVYAYGKDRMQKTELNPLWVKFFSPEQIDAILMQHALETQKFFPEFAQRYIEETARDDESDFADWLKERKKGGG